MEPPMFLGDSSPLVRDGSDSAFEMFPAAGAYASSSQAVSSGPKAQLPELQLRFSPQPGQGPDSDEVWCDVKDLMIHEARIFIVEVDTPGNQLRACRFGSFKQLTNFLNEKQGSGQPVLPSTPRGLRPPSHGFPEMKKDFEVLTEFCNKGLDIAETADMMRGYTWVNVLTSGPTEISILGKACGLHSLTIEDIIKDSYEKSETFPRRGYLYCMVDSEDVRGNRSRIHVLLFRDWVFTIHDREAAAVTLALHRLEEEFDNDDPSSPASSFTCHQKNKGGMPRRHTGHPAWILYSLVDIDVDWMMPSSEFLVQEAEEVDQLVFITSSDEQEDILRRIALARSRIHSLQQRIFSKQRLLMVLCSPSAQQFIPSQVKLYLRDTCDHILWCKQRLNSASEVLAQANNNYLACLSVDAAQLQNKTNEIMRRMGFLATVFVPFTLVAGLMGMNIKVPMRDVESLWPFWGLVLLFCISCCAVLGVLLWLDHNRKKNHLW